MNLDDLFDLLARSFDDRKLSRAERQGLAAAFSAVERGEDRAELRHRAFELVHAALAQPADAELLFWLEDVVKTLYRPAPPAPDSQPVSEAWFSPSQDCARRIVHLFDRTARSAEVCVFTITDDQITEAILTAHARGVAVRILTDNEKADDPGSDIERLRSSGIPLRVDRTPFHMHHKFAIFDRGRLLTGSYNWTRGAARDNHENFLITSDRTLVLAYARAFESLWDRLAAEPER